MNGEVDETYLSDVHARKTENEQASFDQFVEDSNGTEDLGTTVAVVTDPTGGIVEATDMYVPELGMPREYLNKFRSVRSNLDIEDEVTQHNKAANITEIKEKYVDYIQSSTSAQKKIKMLADMVKKGEKITLVCFEKEPKWCHRHVLREEITERAHE